MDADSSANITHTNVLTAALTSAMSADSTVCKQTGIDRQRQEDRSGKLVRRASSEAVYRTEYGISDLVAPTLKIAIHL